MKKKIVRCVCMAVVSALCVGIAAYAYPTPTYKLDPAGTPVVMTVGGDAIHANEYASYMVSAKNNFESQMAQFGVDPSTLWSDSSMVDSVKQSAQSMVTQYHAVLQQFKKEGLKLNKTDLDQIRKMKENSVLQLGGEEAFQQALQSLDLSEQMYDNSLLVSAYAQKLNEHYFGENGVLVPSDKELTDYFNTNYFQAKHILIKTVDDMNQPLAEKEKAKKKALAEEVLKKVQAGGDFDALIGEYNEDAGMTAYPNGYIFTEGEMVDEFYNGTKDLAENGVSGLVESQFGYHIIKRLPLDTSKMADYKDALVAGASGKSFSSLMQEWIDSAAVETKDEEIAKITMDNVSETALTGISFQVTAPAAGAETDPNAAAQ